jgi:hypothetical protein
MDVNKIATHPLQTSFWGEFRKAWGNEILETKYGIITVHKVPLALGKIGIFEKGPSPTRTMLSELRSLGKEKNLIYLSYASRRLYFGEKVSNPPAVLL